MLHWKIFYSDSSYTDQDGSPENAPKRDVQAIAVEDEVAGRRIERSENHYIWVPDRGCWRGVDKFGLYDYLIDPGYKVVLFGRTLSEEEYSAAWTRIAKDDYLPAKSAILRNERRPA